ncbi:hypothetical protein GJ700_20875 [Duganella sp. FT92W]|uniref:Small multi-drug export protein n=1 Tax=Pseudoduganella rivuli TaxID=2666085 RepID=A0A7X2IQZ7_9BURK|nr:hypothetical protein [Pseudoduganella rivuli]MRV74167.1 hypothetical protein [Pseudoduganella rivuli]
MFAKFLSIFTLAMIELWAAVPLGIKLDVDPVAVGALTIAGAIAGTLVAAFAGGLVNKLLRLRTKDPTKGTAGWLVQKGPWAIGLLGPLLLGATISAALASSLGLSRRVWMPLLVAGICVWTVAVTVLTVHGFDLIAGQSAASF